MPLEIDNIAFTGTITPAQITADQNNYNPTDLIKATRIRISSDAARKITGLQGGTEGLVRTFCNVGSFDITLPDADTGSTAANRFNSNGDIIIKPKEEHGYMYDAVANRWQYNGPVLSGGGGPPGTWVQLGKGPTVDIDKNTEHTVLADQTFAAGEVPYFFAVMKSTPGADTHHAEYPTDLATNFDEVSYNYVKKANGKLDFRIRWDQSGGAASKDFDWVVYKVLPS